MFPVTVSAARSERVPSGYGLPVERFRVQFLLRGMAGPALHLCQSFGMRQFLPLEVRVARDACQSRMNGFSESFLVDEHQE